MTTLEIAPFACNTAEAITTAKGKNVGTRYSFIGGQSAKDIRATLKAQGLKGSALDAKVNAVLRGHSTLGEQLAHAFIVAESARGTVWTVAESRNKSAVLKGILAPASASKPVDVTEAAAALSDADKEALVNALLEQLSASQASKTVLEA